MILNCNQNSKKLKVTVYETSTSDTDYNKLSTTDFDEAVNNVIKNLEGGYYHPDMVKDVIKKRRVIKFRYFI